MLSTVEHRESIEWKKAHHSSSKNHESVQLTSSECQYSGGDLQFHYKQMPSFHMRKNSIKKNIIGINNDVCMQIAVNTP